MEECNLFNEEAFDQPLSYQYRVGVSRDIRTKGYARDIKTKIIITRYENGIWTQLNFSSNVISILNSKHHIEHIIHTVQLSLL